MEILKERIRQEGRVIDNRILKVDSFLNHQIDPKLFVEISDEMVSRFKDEGIERVVTIESSGIAIALLVAIKMDVPLVFARKKKSLITSEEVYHANIYSYTKEENYDVTISKSFLPKGEKVLIIDDFLASGEAAMGLVELVESAEDTVAGVAIVVEKSFQPGRKRIEEAGYRVESLVRIKAFENNECVFVEE